MRLKKQLKINYLNTRIFNIQYEEFNSKTCIKRIIKIKKKKYLPLILKS